MKSSNKNISRRKFVTLTSMSSVAFTIGFYFPAAAKGIGEILTAQNADDKGIELTSWISIASTSMVYWSGFRLWSASGYGAVDMLITMASQLRLVPPQVS